VPAARIPGSIFSPDSELGVALQASAGNRAVANVLQQQSAGVVPAARIPSAGNRAVVNFLATANGGEPVKRAAAGATDSLPHRDPLETVFGTDLGDIRVDAGSPVAATALAGADARAAALSDRILFDRTVPDIGLVAHEVAHVLQQRRGGPPAPGSAEREAGDAAHAAGRGEHVHVSEGAAAGVPQFLTWRSGTDAPVIRHDHGFLDDGSGNIDLTKMRAPTAGDYFELTKWKSKLYAAQMFFPGLADATRAYEHFLEGDGADLEVNYEAFVTDDSSGQTVLASAIEDVKDGARIKDNEWLDTQRTSPVPDHSFDMASDPIPVGSGGRYPYPATENWQKAIGAHVCWISAHVDVKVDNATTQRTFTISMTLHMEDRYNFNPGAHDIATGVPDSANGIFEITSLGHEFMQYGSVSREVSLTEFLYTLPGTAASSTVSGEPRGGAPRSSRHDREGEGPD
jgi:hypothetical protein